jgi:hypothetical protein
MGSHATNATDSERRKIQAELAQGLTHLAQDECCMNEPKKEDERNQIRGPFRHGRTPIRTDKRTQIEIMHNFAQFCTIERHE